jgi:hypothetical protein
MLTLDLVDRLLASSLVPRAAKLAAIESWRRELAAMRDKQSECRRLEQRLAEASRLLAAPWPWAAVGQYLSSFLGLGGGRDGVARAPVMRPIRANTGPPSSATGAWR